MCKHAFGYQNNIFARECQTDRKNRKGFRSRADDLKREEEGLAEIMQLEKDPTNRNLGRKAHTCGICGTQGDMQSWLAREMMQGTREEFEYFECPVCGCLQIAEVPENLGDYYGESYYSFSMKEDKNRTFEQPVKSMDKILDVGCGSGAWLVACADAGFGNLFGCDPFLKSDIQYGDRVRIRACTIHEMEGDGTFDLVRMGDSFEHMTDPLEALQSAARLIKPDGYVEIRIPTYPNAAFEMFGPHWYQLDAPRHITLHSQKSISYLAGRCGLVIPKIEYDSNNSWFYRSYFYERNKTFDEITPELIAQCFSPEDIRSVDEMCKTLNENGKGDHMIVYLCKRREVMPTVPGIL